MSMVQSFFPECLQRKPIQGGALPATSRVITPQTGIITAFITSRGPPCETMTKNQTALNSKFGSNSESVPKCIFTLNTDFLAGFLLIKLNNHLDTKSPMSILVSFFHTLPGD